MIIDFCRFEELKKSLNFGYLCILASFCFETEMLAWYILAPSNITLCLEKNWFSIIYDEEKLSVYNFYLKNLSRPATLLPRVTNKSRNQWKDQGNIIACVILSTQVTDRSTDQQNDQYGITMCRYNTYTLTNRLTQRESKWSPAVLTHYYMHLSHTLQSQHVTCNNMCLVITCSSS